MRGSFVSFCFLLSVLLTTSATRAQEFLWAKRLGGTAADQAQGVAVDAAGNVYTVGRFSGTADFDPGPGTFNLTSAGVTNGFVSKLDSAGNFVWAKQLAGTVDVNPQGVAVHASGTITTVGYFLGTADFDPGPGTFNLTAASGGVADAFVSKLDGAGNFLWAKRLGGTAADVAFAVAVGSSGAVYSVGYFVGTADFDPGPGTFNLIAAGNEDVFVSKLDNAGTFLWAKRLGGTSFEEARAVAVDTGENVYAVGQFDGTADFDPGAATFNLTSAGFADAFITRLDSGGNFVWTRQLAGTDQQIAFGVAVAAGGEVYTVGLFRGTTDFDRGASVFNVTSAGADDAFVVKLDGAGNFVWAKQLGGMSNDSAQDVAVAGSGNVYVVGRFAAMADFDPGPGAFNLTSAGSNDAFVCRLDGAGTFLGAKRFGSTGDDSAVSVAVRSDVHTAGTFNDTVDFDPGPATFALTSAGASDAFVQTLGSTGGGAVPNGADVPGVPLKVDKAGGTLLALTWSTSCFSGEDYEVYEGALGNFTSHISLSCSTGQATSLTVNPSAGPRYYLVVPTRGGVEGSYGRSSSGERPPSGLACLPQSLGSCL